MKFGIIVCDPPWQFRDDLKMSDVKRAASAQYPTLTIKELKKFQLEEISAPDCVMALWCPLTFTLDAMDLLAVWGFRFATEYTWMKTTQDGSRMAFGMGHLFRGVAEKAIIGVRGKYKHDLESRSERGGCLHPATKHSVKPETLQDSLDAMFPERDRLEMFARRNRDNWTCIGNEAPNTKGEDIRDALKRLALQEQVDQRESA